VLFQYDNYDFSLPVVFRIKAQCEDNGYSLDKQLNADADHHRETLRVNLSTPKDYVAPLGKGITIAGKARLA